MRRPPSCEWAAIGTLIVVSEGGPATLTATRGGSLGVTTMLELGDKPGLFELTHSAQDLAHHLRGGRGVGNIESGKGAGAAGAGWGGLGHARNVA